MDLEWKNISSQVKRGQRSLSYVFVSRNQILHMTFFFRKQVLKSIINQKEGANFSYSVLRFPDFAAEALEKTTRIDAQEDT